MSWRRKRQLLIAISLLLPLFLIAGLWWFFSRPEPTCFDGRMNQDEEGIDCGGGCEAICQDQVPDPLLVWARSFPVSGTNYSAVALIQNGEDTFEAENVRYVFRILDGEGLLIREVEGVADIPAQEEFTVFHPVVDLGHREPALTTFEFLQRPQWERVDDEDIRFTYSDIASGPHELGTRVQVNTRLFSPHTLEDIVFVAVVFNEDGVAIHSSQTLIEELDPGERRTLTFTWPGDFSDRIERVEVFLSSYEVNRQ